MNKKFLKKLPQIHQNDVQKKFFDATFEQLFSKKQSKKYDGYIGRRVSGVFDLEKDYYLPEIDKNRTWYQLEPASYTRDLLTGDKQNVNFYTDIINRLKFYGGNVGNHDRLFSGEYYTYAPPIDVDKFVNYQNYIWLPIRLLPVRVTGVNDQMVEDQILGSQTFSVDVDGENLDFISGIRVTFPDSTNYRDSYTVEGVGISIRLVRDEQEVLSARRYQPLPWDEDATISGLSLDNREWDNNMWDAIDVGALLRDYITIERGARDSNMWSRTNKWIHRSALETTVRFSKQIFPAYSVRAERPIIEFNRDIELFNFGNIHRADVDAVTGSADISDNLSGLSLADVDGLGYLDIRQYPEFALLSTGSLVVFMSDDTVDPITGRPVKNTVYRVSFEQSFQASFSPTNIVLSEGNNILVKGGNTRSLGGNLGYYFHIVDGEWVESSNTKRSANQPPMFNAYDADAYPLNDNLRYANSTFMGTQIFGYSVDRSPGARNDRELGFPIRYKSSRQGSEIIFENFLETNSYSYVSTNGVVVFGGYQYYRNVLENDQLFDRSRWDFSNGWLQSSNSSRQNVVYKYPVSQDGLYRIDVTPYAGEITNIVVFSDGKEVNAGSITTTYKNNDLFVVVDGLEYGKGFDVEIKVFTHDVLPESSNGYFEIPAQLEANPTQVEVSEISYGELTPHLNTIISNQPEYTGAVSRENNYLNSSRDLSLGTRIIQSKTSMLKSMLVTSNESIDLIDSLRFASRSYVTFKQQLIRNIQDVVNGFPVSGSYIELKKYIDEVILTASNQWVDSGAFSNSNMYPVGDPSAVFDAELKTVSELYTIELVQEGIEYRISEFDVSAVAKREYSVTVNDGTTQLVSGQDYYLSKENGFLIISFASDYSEINVSFTTYEVDALLPYDLRDHDKTIYCYTVDILNGRSHIRKLLVHGLDYSYYFDGLITRIVMHGDYGNNVTLCTYDPMISANIPATPAFLGITDLYRPTFSVDNTGMNPRLVVIGHDGSVMTMYTDPLKIKRDTNGNFVTDSYGVPLPNGLVSTDVMNSHLGALLRYFDIRDVVVYFYELSVFNAASEKLKYDYKNVLTYSELVPSAHRDTRYTTMEISKLLVPSLSRWSALYRLDPKDNMGARNYSKNHLRVWDGFTWIESTDAFMPGSERAILLNYFGTTTPLETPWEMLGFTIKPNWWDNTEDSGDGFIGYSSLSFNQILQDVETGKIRRGNRAGNDVRYAKPGLSLLDISVQSISDIFNLSYTYDSWEVGDLGAVENAWVETSEYRFTQAELMFLMQPAAFGEVFWDTEAVVISGGQLVNRYTGKRRFPENYTVHGEVSDQNEVTFRIGYQQYISDYIRYNNRNVSNMLGDAFRTLDVNLAYKVGGFTAKQGIRAYLESSTQLTSTGGLLIPSSNYQVLLHRGAPIDTNFYTGLIVRKVTGGYQVYGYDLLNPTFKILSADVNSPAQRVTEGGTPVSFVEFEFNRVYPANTIVRYNGTFYLSRTEVNTVSFNKTQWERLPALPITGGVSAVYYSLRSTDVVEISYGHIFSDVQGLFDFMIGLGAYQESRGWVFDRVQDGETNDTWLNAARQTLFWLTVPRKNDESLMLSPLAERAKLELRHGYPENIEKLVNGVYGIVDKYGFSVNPDDTLVSRNDLETTIVSETNGMFGIRVVVSETEHVVLFDQTSEFNDVIYTPAYNTRQGRLRISLTKTQGWFGKLEAPGYIISGNRVLENVDNLTDRFISLYSDVTDVDNSLLTEAARNLIGYDRKDYLDRLSVTDDVQFNFYQGFVRQKGTPNALTKILRSNKITDKNQLDVFEEWMVNLSDYGGKSERVSIEVRSKFDAVEVDNPVYRMNYLTSDRYFVESVIIYNAQTLYTTAPDIAVIGELHVDGRPAQVKAVLGTDRKISRIVVIDSGGGYRSQPSIVVSGISSSDVFMAVTKRSVVVSDKKFDTVIDIDVNDTDKWLYGDVDAIEQTFPMKPYSEIIPTAGPVSDIEVDIQIFNNLYELDKATIKTGTKVHIAKTLQSDWDVAKVVETGVYIKMVSGNILFSDGTTDRSVVQYVTDLLVDSVSAFSYTNMNFNVVTEEVLSMIFIIGGRVYTYRNGALYGSDDKIVKTLGDNSPVKTLRSMRFANISDVDSYDYIDSGDIVYLQENGEWSVVQYGPNTVIRSSEEMIIDSELFTHVNVKYADIINDDVPVYDPVKGVIPNTIINDVDIISETDPAKYTNGTPNDVDADTAFADREVGMVWLDLGSLRFKMYELSNVDGNRDTAIDLEYRRKNWAKVFPGSPVDVYEWVESPLPPAQWNGEGTPKSITEFTVRKVYNSFIDEIEVKYFFWVKNISVVNSRRKIRTKSVLEISNLIRNPGAYQLRFSSPVMKSPGAVSFIVHGMGNTLRRYNARISFGYKHNETAPVVHSDWKLLSNSRFNRLPTVLWDKMVDSLVGYTRPVDVDFVGDFIPSGDKKILPVPAKSLSDFMKTGLGLRPMQTMFSDIAGARTNVFQNINQILSGIKIWEDRFDDAVERLQTAQGWTTADWFANGFNELNTRALLQVETRTQMEQLTGLSTGDLVRVYPFDPVFGVDLYEVYIRTTTGFELVRKQDGIIQLNIKTLLTQNSERVNRDIRTILDVLYIDVFPVENRGLITEVYFAALNFCATENSDMPWAVKTSYISIVQEDRELKQLRFLQQDQLGEYLKYVEDAKPYHTKIRDVAVSYQTSDEVSIETSDEHFFNIKLLFSDFRGEQTVLGSNEKLYDLMIRTVNPSGVGITDAMIDSGDPDKTVKQYGDLVRTRQHSYDENTWVSEITNAARVTGVYTHTVTWDHVSPRTIDGDVFVTSHSTVIDSNGNRGGELVKTKAADIVTLYQYSTEPDEFFIDVQEQWDSPETHWDHTSRQFTVVNVGVIPPVPTGYNEGGWSSDSCLANPDQLATGEVLWLSRLRYVNGSPTWTDPEIYTVENHGVQYGWDGISRAYGDDHFITQVRPVSNGDRMDAEVLSGNGFMMSEVNSFVTFGRTPVYELTDTEVTVSDTLDISNRRCIVLGEVLEVGNKLECSDGKCSYAIVSRSIDSTGSGPNIEMSGSVAGGDVYLSVVGISLYKPQYMWYELCGSKRYSILRSTLLNKPNRVIIWEAPPCQI